MFFSIDTKCLVLDGFSGLLIQQGQAATVSCILWVKMAGIVGGKVRRGRGKNGDEEERRGTHSQVRLVMRRNTHSLVLLVRRRRKTLSDC